MITIFANEICRYDSKINVHSKFFLSMYKKLFLRRKYFGRLINKLISNLNLVKWIHKNWIYIMFYDLVWYTLDSIETKLLQTNLIRNEKGRVDQRIIINSNRRRLWGVIDLIITIQQYCQLSNSGIRHLFNTTSTHLHKCSSPSIHVHFVGDEAPIRYQFFRQSEN